MKKKYVIIKEYLYGTDFYCAYRVFLGMKFYVKGSASLSVEGCEKFLRTRNKVKEVII